ncbi:putative pyridoxal phosphate-dependent aminotransferase EpsN [Sphingomonas sp. 8AM]|nr:putative pyridoxal phosphate-dependent aminotransferase EpsN [Sphingomonas sp. 8AM]
MSGREEVLVSEAFASNWIAPIGPFVSRFEEQLAALCGIPHVAALSSGTAALHLALRLCGIGPGDEVWSATMTFIGGVAPILYEGAIPVFLGVKRDTMLLDLDVLEEQLAQAQQPPKAVITTDLYGLVPDIDRLVALKRRYGFVWISDSAESVGSYCGGRHAGHGADFVILSFNGNKIITTSGGGALVSHDGEAIERARFLSTQAREPGAHYEHRTFGYNYRLSNISAAIGVGQLEVLAERVAARRRIHDHYRMLLSAVPGISFTPEAPDVLANRWLTTIEIAPDTGFDREKARHALEAAQIESRPVWKPMHRQPLFATARYHGDDAADLAFTFGLCLPSGSAMTHEDVERVAAVITALA